MINENKTPTFFSLGVISPRRGVLTSQETHISNYSTPVCLKLNSQFIGRGTRLERKQIRFDGDGYREEMKMVNLFLKEDISILMDICDN